MYIGVISFGGNIYSIHFWSKLGFYSIVIGELEAI
jgi:hypothetical protein